ncbi:hypothetical protein J6590_095767 [Homalodisca vitripennis]|nr:hypothetical protein J6590_096194 [Homalodisca vitripennis]KAG8299643.1 hypothetical protein J6590_095767 [Homalodisca vitripennis]
MLKEWGAIPIQPHLLLMTSVAQHARPVSRGFNTPMRGCRGLNTPVRRGTGGSTRPSVVPRAQHARPTGQADELLPFVFNGVIVTGGEKKWGWRGPSCQLEIARVLE